MAHIEIPLNERETAEFQVKSPPEVPVICAACEKAVPLNEAFQVVATIRNRQRGLIKGRQIMYACSGECARTLYHVQRLT